VPQCESEALGQLERVKAKTPTRKASPITRSNLPRNLLKNVQSHTRHEIKSRHKAHSAIGGISMMVLVSRFCRIPGLVSVFQQVPREALNKPIKIRAAKGFVLSA
jgi:hypothetical protein